MPRVNISSTIRSNRTAFEETPSPCQPNAIQNSECLPNVWLRITLSCRTWIVVGENDGINDDDDDDDGGGGGSTLRCITMIHFPCRLHSARLSAPYAYNRFHSISSLFRTRSHTPRRTQNLNKHAKPCTCKICQTSRHN